MRSAILLLLCAQIIGQPPINIGPILRDEGANVAPIHTLDVTGSATCTVTTGVGTCTISGGGGSSNSTEVSLTIEAGYNGPNLTSLVRRCCGDGTGTGTVNSAAWSPDRQFFVGVGNNGDQFHVSYDGRYWAKSFEHPTLNIHMTDAVWADALDLFVVTGAATVGTEGFVSRSSDGFNWIVQQDPAAQDCRYQSVAWSPDLGILAVVGDPSTAVQNIMTSTDGSTWTSDTSCGVSCVEFFGITWGDGLFVAVREQSGVGTDIATSADGVTWTPADVTAVTASWRGVAYSPELDLFAAVAFTSSGDAVMTSPDAVTWTMRPTVGSGFQDIMWVAPIGKFVATTTFRNLIESSDGITWTNALTYNLPPTADTQFRGIAYSDDLNRIVVSMADTNVLGTAGGFLSTSMDGRTPPGSAFSVTVTGQSWVTSSSNILCQPFGTTADSSTPEAVAAAAFDVSVSDRVVGVGFKVNVFSPHGVQGTFRFHCVGA